MIILVKGDINAHFWNKANIFLSVSVSALCQERPLLALWYVSLQGAGQPAWFV